MNLGEMWEQSRQRVVKVPPGRDSIDADGEKMLIPEAAPGIAPVQASSVPRNPPEEPTEEGR